jgi:hypothetical protein
MSATSDAHRSLQASHDTSMHQGQPLARYGRPAAAAPAAAVAALSCWQRLKRYSALARQTPLPAAGAVRQRWTHRQAPSEAASPPPAWPQVLEAAGPAGGRLLLRLPGHLGQLAGQLAAGLDAAARVARGAAAWRYWRRRAASAAAAGDRCLGAGGGQRKHPQ